MSEVTEILGFEFLVGEFEVGTCFDVVDELVRGDDGGAGVRAAEFQLERGSGGVLPFRGAAVGAGIVVLFPSVGAVVAEGGFAGGADDGVDFDVETDVAEVGLLVEGMGFGGEELVQVKFFLHGLD